MRRKIAKAMLDVETLARLNRVYRVTGDWMLFSMLVTGPMIILAGYVTSEILAPVGLVLFAVALSPLLFFTLMMGLASFNLFGIMDGELWRYLEATLDKAVQLKLPLMSRGEETRLTSVEWTTARFLPRRGTNESSSRVSATTSAVPMAAPSRSRSRSSAY